jgi:hypothetical protein
LLLFHSWVDFFSVSVSASNIKSNHKQKMTYYQSTNRIFKENIIARIYNTLIYHSSTLRTNPFMVSIEQ